MHEIVNCYSGGSYADRPKRFFWMEKEYTVQSILKTWKTPEGKHFSVITAQGETFELFYNIQEDNWQIYQK